MKWFLLTVLVVAVFPLDCHGFPDKPEDRNTADGDQQYLHGPESKDIDSSEADHQMDKTELRQNNEERRGKGGKGDKKILQKLEAIQNFLNNASFAIEKQLQSIKEKKDCPEDMFYLSASNQCFMFLGDRRRNWTAANAACQGKGLVLARPYAPVELRSYLINRYGPNPEVWIDGRGNGTLVTWQRDNEPITSNNPQWYPGNPGSRVTENHCMLIRAFEKAWKTAPLQPYYMWECFNGLFTLCE